jgi:hypothetical protein
MLSHFTWQQYLAAIGFAALAYYLVVLWLYYKKELIRLITGKKAIIQIKPFSTTSSPNLMGAIHEKADTSPESPEQIKEEETISGKSLEFYPDEYPDEDDNQAAISDTFDELEQLSMRLRLLMDNSGKKANRTELTQRIQKELAAFSAKTNPENFKEGINRFVRQQCKELCNVQIEPADLKVIWS